VISEVQKKGKRNWSQGILKFLPGLYTSVIVIFTIINILIIGFYFAVWIGSAQQYLFVGSDFSSIFNTFVNMKSNILGESAKPGLILLLQNGILGGLVENGAYLLQYPPIISLIFLPLSFLPFNIAYYIWTIAQVGLLIWLFILLNRQFPNWTKQEKFLLTITLLAFWPLSITLLLGQFSLLLLLCIVQLYIALKNSRMIRAGIWLAVMMIKPPTVLIPAAITVNRRYIRAALTFIIALIVMVVMSSILYGYLSWYKYSLLLLSAGARVEVFGFVANVEYTFRGLLTGILGNSNGQIINTISMIILFLGIIVAWYLWFARINPDSPRFELRFSFVIALSVFISLHLYPHDALLIVFPAVLFYNFLRHNHYPKKILSILMIVSPFVFFTAAFSKFNLLGIIRPPLIAILILLLYISYYLILDIRKGVEYKNTLLPTE
jgi:hypothetical protein